MNGSSQRGAMMPPWMDFLLTNRVPCAMLVVFMLTAAYLANVLFGNLPIFGFLMLLVGVVLHLAVPSVFALASMGGGALYSLQVGGIAALLVLLLTQGSIGIALGFLALFVLIPTVVAQVLQKHGLGQAAWILAVILWAGLILLLMISMDTPSLKAFVADLFKPVFDDMMRSVPAGETQAVEAMQQLQSWMTAVFPGLMVFGLWFVWWADVVYARKLAMRYGFYQGDERRLLDFALPYAAWYVLVVLAAASLLATGDLQYVASNALLVLVGLLAVQGVMVAHAWLDSRDMVNTIIVMYVMLFFWSAVVIVFALVGLLDFWFNFRRNIVSTTGEK